MTFGLSATKYLSQAGWFPGRTCDTRRFEMALKRDGYDVFPAALEFLRELGGLAGKHPAYRTTTTKEFDFDAARATGDMPKERVDVYAKRFGSSLIPVGEVDNGYITLMISSDGTLLGGLDDYLWVFGKPFGDALNLIFDCREAPQIP